MPTIYRISRPGSDDIADVGSPDAIEPALRSGQPGRHHVDEISAEPLPSGHTARHWGIAIKHPDGTIAVEPDPWEG
jgi:hypothetical protein